MDKEFLKESIWKIKNSEYLFELQKFLDLADNIDDEDLKKIIIEQMLRCDQCITKLAEEHLEKIQNSNIHKMEEE